MNLSQNILWLLKFTFIAAFLASFYIAIQNLRAGNTGSTISFSDTTEFPSFTFCPLKYSYQTLEWISEQMKLNQSFQEELDEIPSTLDAMVKIGFMKMIAYEESKDG